MELLVDIGNTRLRWCCAEQDQCTPAVIQAYERGGVATLLQDHWATVPAPRRIVVANVAGEDVARAVDRVTDSLWGLQPEFIKPVHQAYGVTNGYLKPAQLGADRWAAMVAAQRLFGGTKYLVDCGTATTLDILAADGRHLGGLILPGLTMMRRALLGGTSDLYMNDELTSSGQQTRLAHETSDAIKAGTLHTLAAAVNGLARDMEAELHCRLERVITGGNAAQLMPLIGPGYTHEPDLVLKGLLIMAGEGP